jgi:hypothetical protein
MRLVPTSWGVFSQAWNTFVYYANFHLPPEPNGFYGYNALRQLVYFSTIFIMTPLAILTGMTMSPALVNRFPRYVRIFRGRQGARSIHFIVMVGFVYFIIAHVTPHVPCISGPGQRTTMGHQFQFAHAPNCCARDISLSPFCTSPRRTRAIPKAQCAMACSDSICRV